MKNIQTYCDNIFYLIEKYGEEYINHFYWELVPADECLRNESSTCEKEKTFEGNIQLANDLGQLCNNYRNTCIEGIKENLLFMRTTNLNIYAKALLEKMWDIQLNQVIGNKKVFKAKIIPEVFIPIIDILKEQGININKIVSECRSKSGDGFCSWISLKETVSNDKSIQEQDQKEAFRNLFKEEYRKYIESFIKQLEINEIIKQGTYIYTQKNYLAKIFVFLRSEGIIECRNYTSGVRCFYEYFSTVVCNKVGNKKDAIAVRGLVELKKGLSSNDKDSIEIEEIYKKSFPNGKNGKNGNLKP